VLGRFAAIVKYAGILIWRYSAAAGSVYSTKTITIMRNSYFLQVYSLYFLQLTVSLPRTDLTEFW